MRPASFPCSWSVPCSCFRRIIAGFMMEKSTLVSAGTLRILPKGADCTDLFSGFVELFRLVYFGEGVLALRRNLHLSPLVHFSLLEVVAHRSWTLWAT